MADLITAPGEYRNTVALEEYLKPLAPYLDDPDISEIYIHKPNQIYIERKSFFERIEVNGLDMRHLLGVAKLVSRYSEQRLSEKEPLLSAQIPGGFRIQIILPPATAVNNIVIAIRKPTLFDVGLNDYVEMGAFKRVKPKHLDSHRSTLPIEEENRPLVELFRKGEFVEFIKRAVASKKNIIVSGATSTGKTTFLNACLKEIPLHEHIVTLEDVPEVKLSPQAMHTPLFASKGGQGVAKVTMQNLVEASLRIRPDRIIMGELRGAEAADFINATATGHDGSISSLHSASAHMAFMRLVHMVKLGGTNLSREDILEDLHTVVDVVIQLRRRIEGNRYVREVSEIYYADATAFARTAKVS